jgi:hypothetical protein
MTIFIIALLLAVCAQYYLRIKVKDIFVVANEKKDAIILGL